MGTKSYERTKEAWSAAWVQQGQWGSCSLWNLCKPTGPKGEGRGDTDVLKPSRVLFPMLDPLVMSTFSVSSKVTDSEVGAAVLELPSKGPMCLWLAVCRNLLGTAVGLTPGPQRSRCAWGGAQLRAPGSSRLNVSVLMTQASASLTGKCPGAWGHVCCFVC